MPDNVEDALPGSEPAQPVSMEIKRLLDEARDGDGAAVNKLLPLLYDELHNLAAAALRRERPNHSLQATALINEAYLRLVDQRNASWQNRAHFMAVASQTMRRVLVDHARSRLRLKRGAGLADRLRVPEDLVPALDRDEDVVALDEALQKLSAENEMDVRIIEMRFFAGLDLDEVAAVLQVNEKTVRRHWNFARAWLYRELSANRSTGAPSSQ